MSSILTNNGAMVALQTLKSVNDDLNTTQSNISTGKEIGSAKDNSAVWAISKTMESDIAGFEAIEELIDQEIEWQGEPVEWDAKAGRRRGKKKPNEKTGKQASERGKSRTAKSGDQPEKADAGAKAAGPASKPASEQKRSDGAKPENSAKSGKAGKASRRGDGDGNPFGDEDAIPAFLRN